MPVHPYNGSHLKGSHLKGLDSIVTFDTEVRNVHHALQHRSYSTRMHIVPAGFCLSLPCSKSPNKIISTINKLNSRAQRAQLNGGWPIHAWSHRPRRSKPYSSNCIW